MPFPPTRGGEFLCVSTATTGAEQRITTPAMTPAGGELPCVSTATTGAERPRPARPRLPERGDKNDATRRQPLGLTCIRNDPQQREEVRRMQFDGNHWG